jgi:anti-anti-sigma regulatory factor
MTISGDLGALRSLTVETVRHEDAAWVILRGEADLATLGHLELALARTELDGTRVVHLHVTGLDFADVGTLQQLTRFAREAKFADREVRTCGASSTFRKVARLLSLHDDLGLA